MTLAIRIHVKANLNLPFDIETNWSLATSGLFYPPFFGNDMLVRSHSWCVSIPDKMNDVNLDEASPVWPQLPGPLRLLQNRLSISFGGAELRYNRSPSTGPFLVRRGNVSA